MPKVKENLKSFLSRMVLEFKGEFRNDGTVLFCKSCSVALNATKKFHVNQHISTEKHKESVKWHKATNEPQQILLAEATAKPLNEFFMDLSDAFVKANIPLHKLSKKCIINCLEKHTKKAVPSVSVIRSKYLPILFNNCMENMRKKAHNKFIWISVDETTGNINSFNK